MAAPVIEFRNVSKKFGDHKILKRVNLSIKQDDILGLVGRSGSGKTTLFRLFLGIYDPSSGGIYFNGKKVSHRIKQEVGFASQENSFYPRLTVEENLQYFGKMYNLSNKEISFRITRLLELVQLEEARHTWAMRLSGGMKRRLDLAIALIHDPQVLILDEPTTGLDVILLESIWELIMRIHGLGKTIIISSHNLQEIEKYCTSIAFMSKGEVTEWQDVKRMTRRFSLEQLFRRMCK